MHKTDAKAYAWLIMRIVGPGNVGIYPNGTSWMVRVVTDRVFETYTVVTLTTRDDIIAFIRTGNTGTVP